MKKNERIAALEKEVADLRHTIQLLQWQISTMQKAPVYVPYIPPQPLLPTWYEYPTTVSDRTSISPDIQSVVMN